MDDSQFDAITRALHSRRVALNTLVGGAAVQLGLVTPEEVGAHNFVARCRKLSDSAKRRACLKRARTHNRKHQCKPKPPVTFCGTRCGTAINNCKKRVTCPTVCPAQKTCLSNGGCGQICGLNLPDCPDTCLCNGPEPGPGGRRLCIPTLPICEDVPIVCASTADCPLGTFCFSQICPSDDIPPVVQNRCVPLCAA